MSQSPDAAEAVNAMTPEEAQAIRDKYQRDMAEMTPEQRQEWEAMVKIYRAQSAAVSQVR